MKKQHAKGGGMRRARVVIVSVAKVEYKFEMKEMIGLRIKLFVEECSCWLLI